MPSKYPEQTPLLVKIDTEVEYIRPAKKKSLCNSAEERAKQLKSLFVKLLLYILVVAILTVLVFFAGTYGQSVVRRNLKMVARSWDPKKPRWFQLFRVAPGIENGPDRFRNLTYPDCISVEVRSWHEINAADFKWLEKYKMNETAYQRDVFAMTLPSQDVATVLCPPSTYLGEELPVDFN